MNTAMKIDEVVLKVISVAAPCHTVNSGSRIPFEPEVRLSKQFERDVMHESGESALPIALCCLSHAVQTR
jgi:hypothetical protein